MITKENKNFGKNFGIFLFLTALFSLLSFGARVVLISNFDRANFKLFTIDYVKNYGAAFSLFHTHTDFLILLSLIIFFAVIFYIYKNILKFSKFEILFSSLLTAGILCNLTERIFDGFVTDYIRLNFIVFPIFNLSDVFINIGAFILICNILFNNEQEEK